MTSNRSDWSKLQPVAGICRCRLTSTCDSRCRLAHTCYLSWGTQEACVKAEFPQTYELHTLVAGNTNEAMTDSVGFGISKIASLLQVIKPNVVVIHGDRFDAFSAAGYYKYAELRGHILKAAEPLELLALSATR